MSQIKIVCRKNKEKKYDTTNFERLEQDNLDGELIIEASQLFMDTKTFFESVKENLTQYFDSIQKKK
jgi:hypothetical protein